MAQSRKEAGIDRQVRELYKEFCKGADKALDQLKRNPLTSDELKAKIKQENESLQKLEEMWEIGGDFGGTLEQMRGHIAGLLTIQTHTHRAEEYASEAKKKLRQEEHAKEQAKAAKENEKVAANA